MLQYDSCVACFSSVMRDIVYRIVPVRCSFVFSTPFARFFFGLLLSFVTWETSSSARAVHGSSSLVCFLMTCLCTSGVLTSLSIPCPGISREPSRKQLSRSSISCFESVEEFEIIYILIKEESDHAFFLSMATSSWMLRGT